MNDVELKHFCIRLMETSESAILTTVNENGYPYIRAMLNLRNAAEYPSLVKLFKSHEEDLLIYFTTSTDSEKVRQIRNNPKVSVYYHKPKLFEGAMMSGTIEIVTDPEIKKNLWQDGWEMYYPTGYDDPNHTVLCLIPQLTRGWLGTEPFELKLGNTG